MSALTMMFGPSVLSVVETGQKQKPRKSLEHCFTSARGFSRC